MTTLSGNSTGSTKRSLEGYLFIDAANQIHDVGVYTSLGNGSGSYARVNDCFPAANNAPYTFNASGEDLMGTGLAIVLAQPFSSDIVFLQDAAAGKPEDLVKPGM